MHNEVVKSDIHSTDPDGYSEVVFGVTHLLGFSFAPRLKNLKAKTIYSFHKHPWKAYQDQGFRILPAKYINEQLSQLIAREQDPERRQQLLELMRLGSMATWEHLNLHGEYDFSQQKMQDTVGLEAPKNREMNLV